MIHLDYSKPEGHCLHSIKLKILTRAQEPKGPIGLASYGA